MRVFVVLGLFVGMAAAAACASFSEPEPNASSDAGTDESVMRNDAGLDDAADASDSVPVPLIRWSFDGNGAASTNALGDTMLLSPGAGYGEGVLGSALHCPATSFAATAPTGTPFEIGRGDATFVVWIRLDAQSETVDAGDRLHTFFDRNMNWATSAGKGTGYGLGYTHTVGNPFLQGAVVDATGSYTTVTGRVELADGAFHMIALVVDQESLAVFSDGVVRGTAVLQRGGPIGNGPDAGPIRLCDIYSNYLRGSLDELMIFPRALTPAEIQQVQASVEGRK